MNLRYALGAAALAAATQLAPAARGAVVLTVSNLGGPASPTAPAAAAFQAYRLTLSTTDGASITAVDFGGPAGNPRGMTGTFLQRASLDPDAGTRSLTPQNAALNNVNAFSFDSHFLLPASSRVDVSAPNEDNSGLNPPGAPADTATGDFGAGTFLTGTFGLLTAAQGPTIDLAYLVIPDNSTAMILGEVSTTSGIFPVSATVPAPVPEPAAAGVVACVAGALIVGRGRRRR